MGGRILLALTSALIFECSATLNDFRDSIRVADIPTITGLGVVNSGFVSGRGADGKGPAWWAIESGADPKTVGLLLALGVDFLTKEKDSHNRGPLDYLKDPLTKPLLASWEKEAMKAKKVVHTVKQQLVEKLQDQIHGEKALAEELDSFDE